MARPISRCLPAPPSATSYRRAMIWSLVIGVENSPTTVEEPAIVKPPLGAGASLYVAAEAFSPAASVVHTVPDVNAVFGAVPGAAIVCSAAPWRLISPGARLAQLAALTSCPVVVVSPLQALVMAVTPPWAPAGSLP